MSDDEQIFKMDSPGAVSLPRPGLPVPAWPSRRWSAAAPGPQRYHCRRVLLGSASGQVERTVAAETRTYLDAKSGQTVYAQHARLTGLRPDHEYVYAAVHDGAEAEFGSLRTAPRGRARFTFTSFGDQGTPTTGKRFVPPAGVTVPSPPFVNDNLGSPAAGDVTAGVERVQPLCHLFKGQVTYYDVVRSDGQLSPFESFTLQRRRSD